MMKKLITILSLAVLLTLPSASTHASDLSSDYEETNGTAIVLDVLIARPLGITSLAIGTVVFIVALPYTIPSWTIGRTADKLIADPFRFTFLRPVGEVWEAGD
jgi:hypothetical protein